MPALRDAWCALAEETAATLSSTDPTTLTTALADLAAGLSGRPAAGQPSG